MSIEQCDAKTAWNHYQSDPQALIVDVRTEEEFTAGHPKDSLNIPILVADPKTTQRAPNLDFDAVVKANIPIEKTLYITCHSGKRSMMAAMRMEAMGYQQLINVQGGFGGSPETPGWQDCGLPAEEGQPANRCYQDLISKTPNL